MRQINVKKCQTQCQNIDKFCQIRYDRGEQNRNTKRMQEEQNVYESSGAGRLKTLREQAGLTQQELSRQTGVSRSLISQWENGVISVSLATKKRVAAYFGVDVSELDGEATGAQAAPAAGDERACRTVCRTQSQTRTDAGPSDPRRADCRARERCTHGAGRRDRTCFPSGQGLSGQTGRSLAR